MNQEPVIQPTTTPLPVAPLAPEPRKKGLFIAAIVAGVLLLLGGGSWLYIMSAQNSYVTGATTYEEKLESAFLAYKNSTDIENQVDETLARFDEALAAKPVEPSFLGIKLYAPDDKKQRIAEITESFTTLRNDFKAYHDFNKFADELLSLLSEIEETNPILEFREAPAVYTKAAEDVRALQGPAGINDLRTAKADTLALIAADSEKLAEYYDKVDLTNYNATQAALQANMRLVDDRTVVEELTKLYRVYYDTLSDHYDATAKVLGVEG